MKEDFFMNRFVNLNCGGGGGVCQITEMEGIRVEGESKKKKSQQQRLSPGVTNSDRLSKDSGVVDVEVLKLTEWESNRLSAPECDRLKRSPLSNSLNDITDRKQ